MGGGPSGGRGFVSRGGGAALPPRARYDRGRRRGHAAHPVKEVVHGGGRNQGTSGVRGAPIHAGIAGQEDRYAARLCLRVDGRVTPLKQESLRGREASGSK